MRLITALIILFSVTFLGCTSHQNTNDTPKVQLYTTQNIWNHPGSLYCINFKLGSSFIPAGTAIKNVKIDTNADWPSISFRIVDTNKLITLNFVERWHPGHTVNSYTDKLFSPKDFTALTHDFSPAEIKGIKKGLVMVGMSKQAVLVSYGHPPEHYTANLQSDEWYYWMSRIKKKKICFDDNERAFRCGDTSLSNKL